MSGERSHPIFIDISEELSYLSDTSNEHCIFRVHHELRSHNVKAYEPRILSIGPYHNHNCNLEKMEMWKLKCFQELLERIGKESVDKCIIALTEQEDRARRCYAEEIELPTHRFVKMMCLDGLFVIEFLRKWHQCTSTGDDTIFQKDWLSNSIFRDLLLLENQIPFFILNELFELTKAPDEKYGIIQLGLDLCYLMKGFRHPYPEDNATKISVDEVSHLLDLVHKGWCSSFAATISEINNPVIDWSPENIKSATELRKSGVMIRSATEYKSWLHITFKDGIIEVPTLTVDDFTETILRNLIAYEQYVSNLDNRSYVTDYVKFLDLLIDSPRDVKELRCHGIIENWLGDDELVCTMINKLLRDVSINDWTFCYSGVFKDVKYYSSSRWNSWRAHCVVWADQLMTNYFSSPWSIISFLAAVVLLILTVVQTIFSILAVNKGK